MTTHRGVPISLCDTCHREHLMQALPKEASRTIGQPAETIVSQAH